MIIEFSRSSEINVKRLNSENCPKYPKLLDITNSIIDWENSIFPKTIEIDPTTDELHEIQNRKLFGDNPALKPGWTFNYYGQELVFIDNDTLFILDTESGGFGLIRAMSHILAEYKISHGVGYLQNIKLPSYFKNNFNHLTKLADFWGDVYILDPNEVTYDLIKKEEIDREEQNGWNRVSLPISVKDLASILFSDNEWIDVKVTAESILLFPAIISINPYFGVCIYNEDEIVDEDVAKSIILSYLVKQYLKNKKK